METRAVNGGLYAMPRGGCVGVDPSTEHKARELREKEKEAEQGGTAELNT